MIEAMIVAAGSTAYWSSAPGLELVVRPLIFVFLLLAAMLAVVGRKLRPMPTSASELLLYAIGILSCAVALIRSVDYSIYYSMYYLTAIICFSVIIRTVPLERLMDLTAYSIFLCALTTLLLDRKELAACLSISITRNGLLRFTPFGNHPLLVGYIFGSGSILMIRRAYVARLRWERYAMVGAALLAWIMVLAASARSAVLGLAAAALFAVIAELRFLRRKMGPATWVAAIVVSIAAVYFAANSSYLQDILQVNSTMRGVGSGATGRTDLWLKGLTALTSDPSLMVFGGGLRSSDYAIIGFLTENSYITILLDSGALLGSVLILFFLLAPFDALRKSRSASGNANGLVFLPSFFVFLLVQCFFVRYLVGLGTPTALFTLLLLISLSMHNQFEKSGNRLPTGAGVSIPSKPYLPSKPMVQ